eukprot:5919583-Pyramimonas_sp.AAC.1
MPIPGAWRRLVGFMLPPGHPGKSSRGCGQKGNALLGGNGKFAECRGSGALRWIESASVLQETTGTLGPRWPAELAMH